MGGERWKVCERRARCQSKPHLRVLCHFSRCKVLAIKQYMVRYSDAKVHSEAMIFKMF